MAGFLSLFEGVERVTVAPGFWIDVKKSLSADDYAAAQRALLGTMKMDSGGMHSEPDSVGYQQELVFLAIADWNLTDASETQLPLVPESLKRESIKRLPQSVFLDIYQRVTAASTPRSPEDEMSFRNGSEGSTDGRESGAPITAEVSA